MKISEIEAKFKTEGFSEALFEEYQTALRRVPKAQRSQHCYSTAYELRHTDTDSAVRMVEYALEHCENTWTDLMRAYRNLGAVYEAARRYREAKQAYEASFRSICEAAKDSYAPDHAMYILRTALHCSNFTYSDEIRSLYQTVCKADSFSAAFRHFIYYRSIAKIVIALHDGDHTACREGIEGALYALDGEVYNPMDKVLKRHRFVNEAHATQESLTFLLKMERSVSAQ